MTKVMSDESLTPTVERLLEAAEAEFAARGFAEARLEDIASVVGVRRASLLYHFATKQELYDRVLERAFGELQAMVVATLGRASARYTERLEEVVGRAIDNFTRRPLFARLLLRDALDHEAIAAERARKCVLPLLELSDAFLRAGQAAGEFRAGVEPRPVVMMLVGAIVFHAASCDAHRDVLWGPGRATGRNLRAYRDEVRGMVRRLVFAEPVTQRPRTRPVKTLS
jgi:TetR/AcrR family transcriptional regulator